MLRGSAASPRPSGGVPMDTVVINRVTLTVPAEEVVADVARELPAVFEALEGFRGFTSVQTGSHELVMIIRWASPEAAANGAAVIGPGAFNTWVAPRASGQDRVVGPVAVDIGWGA
jgi:hypothetical protein